MSILRDNKKLTKIYQYVKYKLRRFFRREFAFQKGNPGKVLLRFFLATIFLSPVVPSFLYMRLPESVLPVPENRAPYTSDNQGRQQNLSRIDIFPLTAAFRF